MDDATEKLGWYGKIPAAGDFVHRRLPRELIAWWDRWLQYGLAALKQAPDDSAARSFAAAPIWNFAIPAGPSGNGAQLGCIAPSRDRVGRGYPLCVIMAIPADAYHSSMLDGATDYYRQIGASMLSAVRHGCAAEQFDRELQDIRVPGAAPPVERSSGSDIMDILNAGLESAAEPVAARSLAAWPDLPFCFNPSSHTSYWWTNQVDGAALQTYVHGGSLNAALFTRLFASLPAWR
ncbi:type VI secretion system-associated protein TagF [Bordetella petrii]|uniref:type VI secretion system-associated protein TagF n=1 Tax=Bordetella petrii TaxID=94624 RepID=UPI001A963B7C|nr:type VI secretion system-associated protein TagF [Bordetella petrii]MBO1113997.1 type VI secretion system-associated protein TagF [Bordetella petrii]